MCLSFFIHKLRIGITMTVWYFISNSYVSWLDTDLFFWSFHVQFCVSSNSEGSRRHFQWSVLIACSMIQTSCICYIVIWDISIIIMLSETNCFRHFGFLKDISTNNCKSISIAEIAISFYSQGRDTCLLIGWP